jgi:methyl-accepting chemotaxis protein
MSSKNRVMAYVQNWKLTKKFLAGILPVLAVVMTALVLILSIQQKGTLIEDLRETGKNSADFLASISAEPILYYNYSSLKNYVRDIAREKAVVYAIVEDKQGKPVASHSKETKTGDANKESEEILAFTAPVFMNKDQIGIVKIGYSTQYIKKSLRESQLIIIGLSVGMMAAISLIVYLLFRVIVLKPIGSLNATIARVASGDLSHTVDVTSNDEVGALGRAVNKMVEDLKRLIASAHQTAMQTATSAEQIAAGSHRVNEGAMSTSKATEETLTSMTEMVSSIKGVAENAGEMSHAATNASSSALEMASSVEEVARNAGTLAAAVEETASSIVEMIASIKQVSENTDVVASSAEETSAAIAQMSASVKEVEERAVDSARLAEKVSQDASNRGMIAAAEAIQGMQNIKEAVEATAAVVNRLGKRSQEIGQILKVIDEVTDQTGLLALNAAILAAQAGERGKGFAVVAEEIKDLAERTASSTQEISSLIASVQEETSESVDAMGRGLKAVEVGVSLVNVTSDIFRQVADSSRQSADTARAIEKTTAEQAKGVAQIMETAVGIADQIDQVARALQEQRAGSERIAQAAERMRESTRQVKSATQEQTTGSRQIASAVESVTVQASQIARSTSEQSQGAQQISEAITRIQKITQETVDVSIEMDMSVHTLRAKADTLQKELNDFKF